MGFGRASLFPAQFSDKNLIGHFENSWSHTAHPSHIMLIYSSMFRFWINFDFSLIRPLPISDARVKEFPLMDTPIPTAAFILCYLAWVVVIGPLYMRDRKPYNLKNTLIYYNAFQVLLSAYMFYEVRHFSYRRASKKSWPIFSAFSIWCPGGSKATALRARQSTIRTGLYRDG